MPEYRLLPQDYSRAIETPASRDHDPERLIKSIRKADATCDSALKSTDPEAFAIPIETALFLYRRDPQKHLNLVLRAVVDESIGIFWLSLAAAARDAFDAGDYYLLGCLSYRFDRGSAEQHWRADGAWSAGLKDHTDNQRETMRRQGTKRLRDYSETSKLRNKLSAAFQYAIGPRSEYATPRAIQLAALGYLESIPAEMIVPPGLLTDEDQPAWRLLRAFLRTDAAIFGCDPALTNRLRQIGHPQLPCCLPPETDRPVDPDRPCKRMRNPFQSLAAKYAVDPKHAQPKTSTDVTKTKQDEVLLEVEDARFDAWKQKHNQMHERRRGLFSRIWKRRPK